MISKVQLDEIEQVAVRERSGLTSYKARLLIDEIRSLNATVAAAKSQVEAMREALTAAYEENQNIHCSTTISPKIGWDALNRQSHILRTAIKVLSTQESKP